MSRSEFRRRGAYTLRGLGQNDFSGFCVVVPHPAGARAAAAPSETSPGDSIISRNIRREGGGLPDARGLRAAIAGDASEKALQSGEASLGLWKLRDRQVDPGA